MRKLSNPTLKASLGLVAAAMIAFASTAIISMAALNENSTKIVETWLPKVGLSKSMETALSDLRRSYLNHVVALTDDAHAAAAAAISTDEAHFREELAQYAKWAESEEERSILTAVSSRFDEISVIGKSVIDLSSSGKQDEAINLQ